MLITKTNRRSYSFNLDDREDRESYEEILNNPAAKILSKKFVTQSETIHEGESSTTTSEQHIYLEVEECSL